MGAKLAVGCLLALGLGAGCVAFTESPGGPPAPRHSHRSARAGQASGVHHALDGSLNGAGLTPGASRGPGAGAVGLERSASAAALSPAEQAAREFGPERGSGQAEARSSFSADQAPRASSVSSAKASSTTQSSGERSTQAASQGTGAARAAEASSAPESSAPTPADREFGIG
jgi:hypothetical protein